MVFLDSLTEELFPDRPPLQDQPSSLPREPVWLLLLGMLMFAVLLAFTWLPNFLKKPELSSDKIRAAKLHTYAVEMLLYQQANRRIPSAIADGNLHKQATAVANSWNDLNRAVIRIDAVARRKHLKPRYGAEYAARLSVNSAALFGAADNLPRAGALLNEAIVLNPGGSASYRQLLALYQPGATPITLAPATDQLLLKISSGPILRARNAYLTANRSAVLAALRPGERAARHGEVMSLVYFLWFLGGVVLFFILLIYLIIDMSTNAGSLMRLPPLAADAPGWGIGMALIVISTVFITIGLVNGLFEFLLPIQSRDVAVSLPMQGGVELICATGVLSLFLMVQGKSPWSWSAFGWHASRKQIGLGLATLFLTYPFVILLSWLSSSFFHDTSANPMITSLEHTTNPWLVMSLLVMASVVAPLVEETLFRGILFRALEARLSFWSAAFVSGVIFAIGHGELVVIFPITLLGVAFAFLARKTGNLWPSAVAHGVFNAIASLAILLSAWAMHGPGS